MMAVLYQTVHLALQHEFAARVEEARGVQSAQGKSAERIEALVQSMLALSFTEGLSRAFVPLQGASRGEL
jgi:hypothetical protein